MTSPTGTRHQASVGGPSLPGISTERMSHAALSTPLAHGQLPAILMPPSTNFDFGRWRVGDGEQVVRIVPDLLLRLEWKERRHPAEADRQRAAPAGAAAGAAEFEADLRELGRTVFVAAEAFGLHQAEDAGVAQRRHGLGGYALGFLGGQRAGIDLRSELADACEDVGEFGPWRSRAAQRRALWLPSACFYSSLRSVTNVTVRSLHRRGGFDKSRISRTRTGAAIRPRRVGDVAQCRAGARALRCRKSADNGVLCAIALRCAARAAPLAGCRANAACGSAQPCRNTVTASRTVWSTRLARSLSLDAEVSQLS